MILVKPGSTLHSYRKNKVEQRVRLTIEPDTESE